MKLRKPVALVGALIAAGVAGVAGDAEAQLRDIIQAPNARNAGIQRSFIDQVGDGVGDVMTPNTSRYIIARDPARAVRRGRQLFQRKFTIAQGVGPTVADGTGDIATDIRIGAGLADSCAACHARPRGSAGFGGAVVTTPDSRDAPHLFGLGLQEMLADEMTADLRAIQATAIAAAAAGGAPVTMPLAAKGVSFGTITAMPDGTVDTTAVEGVNPDLRIRPFFAHGGDFGIREFAIGAFQNELGMQPVDAVTTTASTGGSVMTPAGLMLDGAVDIVVPPPAAAEADDPDADGVANEIPEAIVDFMEFYLLNYFKPGIGEQTRETTLGRVLFNRVGCTNCHIESFTINNDRRAADLETNFDDVMGNPINRLFAVGQMFWTENAADVVGADTLKVLQPNRQFVVRNIFTDFKRHDLGVNFHENLYDGMQFTAFQTEALWGVGTTPTFGHDGRSNTLTDVILRHGGEALAQRDLFAALSPVAQGWILDFLNSLILFGPDDTASNLAPQNTTVAGYPQAGHGAIALTPLFNDQTVLE